MEVEAPRGLLRRCEEVDGGHGRVETRRIRTTEWTVWHTKCRERAGLRSFVCVESEWTNAGPRLAPEGR